MLIKSPKTQRGATLLELLLSLALGVTAITALAGLVGYGMGVNANLLSSSRVNEELGNLMLMIQRDVRRAGYSGNTLAMVGDPAANPSPFANSIAIGAYPGEAANSCILFSYDNDNNGVLDAVAGNNENFGYRLRDGQVEMRVNSLLCVDDGWLVLSDPDTINVTGLTFVLNQIVENNVTSNEITLTLQGELATNNAISRRFDSSFVVRNYD
ncbi:prepilin cleavage protein [Alteromonas sp. ASW11-36]|uniref:Prepilin cleavage protein n=1 Tax=Alteromonas arenosi TaxID=3055817 RepID=A0ABT7SXA0_9ALTE|nr:prepilin cleavage protein [Alteromonas sp. ASW11-36]MDM7860814.1 prepilin cleavage protein [Alteromonas sp. ASW11-36]